ncbi:uncharacterized protein LOC144664280 [Oculina patagonica]
MQDPTVYLKCIEEIILWEDVMKKKRDGEDPQPIIREYKKNIQDARLKSAELPSYFIMTINMEGKAKRDDRVLLLSIIMSTYYSSVIFCQETPGHFERDIVNACGTFGYGYFKNENSAAVLWRTEDFESSTDGLKPTDRSMIQIRDKVKTEVNDTTELLSRIAMVKLTCRKSSETVLAVSWHGPHRGHSKTIGKPQVFNGLTTFLQEVCKAKNIPTFLIGGDFNLNTLDDELSLGKNVSVPVYELSHRQMKRSIQPSGYIPRLRPLERRLLTFLAADTNLEDSDLQARITFSQLLWDSAKQQDNYGVEIVHRDDTLGIV